MIATPHDIVFRPDLELQVRRPHQHLHDELRAVVLRPEIVPVTVLPLHHHEVQLRLQLAQDLGAGPPQAARQLVAGAVGVHDVGAPRAVFLAHVDFHEVFLFDVALRGDGLTLGDALDA